MSYPPPYASVKWDLFTTIDPDFDDLGGELSLAQYCDPMPEPYGAPVDANTHKWQPEQPRSQRKLIRDHKKQLSKLAARLEAAMEDYLHDQREMLSRWCNLFNWMLEKNNRNNPQCRHCIPCNGRHTPNYWGNGTPDCW